MIGWGWLRNDKVQIAYDVKLADIDKFDWKDQKLDI